MHRTALPYQGVWRRFIMLIPLIIVLVIISRLYIRSVGGTYEVRGENSYTAAELAQAQVSFDVSDVVEVVSIRQSSNGRPVIVFRALRDGDARARLATPYDMGVDHEEQWTFSVRGGTIFEDGICFSGWQSIHICVCVFFAVLAALFASVFIKLWRTQWYDYEMVAAGGGLMFSLFQFAIFFWLWMRNGMGFSFIDFLVNVSAMVEWFVGLSAYPMSVLALLVSLSNIVLIQREGKRLVNLLGIGFSLMWAALNVAWLVTGSLLMEAFDSVELLSAVDSVIATAMAFGECLLFSTIICGWLASRHVPTHALDYTVVLGCGIRKDGTPSPLLAGRVDKAREFDEARIALGESPTIFVPSGGQGADEVMSEAQSMRDYLVGRGVAADRIVLEGRSTSTRENMAFSREVIERHAGRDASELSVGFSTTNYHVFRGYVCAHEAGMYVEGMGSKTRAYFWPNAFLREFVGLLAAQWKAILQIYIVIAAFYVIAEYLLLFT